MIHTNLPRNCVVSFTVRTNTVGHFYGSPKFDSHKWLTVLVDDINKKENRAISRHVCVDRCILLLQHLSNHMHFITNVTNAFQRPTRPNQGNVFL